MVRTRMNSGPGMNNSQGSKKMYWRLSQHEAPRRRRLLNAETEKGKTASSKIALAISIVAMTITVREYWARFRTTRSTYWSSRYCGPL